MNSVSPETAGYFMGLPLHRQLQFLVDSWGARPVWALSLVEDERRRRHVVCVVGLVNAIEKLELENPPDAIYAAKYTPSWDLNLHISRALWAWHKGVFEHLDTRNAAAP